MRLSAKVMRFLHPAIEQRRMELRRLMSEACAHADDIRFSVKGLQVEGVDLEAAPKRNGVKKHL